MSRTTTGERAVLLAHCERSIEIIALELDAGQVILHPETLKDLLADLAESEERVKELERVTDNAKDPLMDSGEAGGLVHGAGSLSVALEARIAELEAREKALRDLLWRVGKLDLPHEWSCASTHRDGRPCDCPIGVLIIECVAALAESPTPSAGEP